MLVFLFQVLHWYKTTSKRIIQTSLLTARTTMHFSCEQFQFTYLYWIRRSIYIFCGIGCKPLKVKCIGYLHFNWVFVFGNTTLSLNFLYNITCFDWVYINYHALCLKKNDVVFQNSNWVNTHRGILSVSLNEAVSCFDHLTIITAANRNNREQNATVLSIQKRNPKLILVELAVVIFPIKQCPSSVDN